MAKRLSWQDHNRGKAISKKILLIFLKRLNNFFHIYSYNDCDLSHNELSIRLACKYFTRLKIYAIILDLSTCKLFDYVLE